MSTDFFYSDLPVLENFLAITDSRNFQPVSSDWSIVVTDIVGSTQAIELGRYKEVNLLGASSIVAVLNIAGNLDIPFVFGGDGATLLIPPSLASQTRQVLLATRRLARIEFNMDLRVGAVPISDVIEAGYEVSVAKLRISESYCQAAFTGNGLSYATERIKEQSSPYLYNYKDTDRAVKADFSGLKCPWQDIPSKHEEIVSLIVMAMAGDPEINNQIYRQVIEKILLIYGGEDALNPIAKEHLRFAFSYKDLKSETRIRAKSSKFWHQWLYFAKILLENLLGWFLITFRIQVPEVDWGTYKDTLIAATDYKKFDDILRMVIAGDAAKRKQLTHYLEENYQTGRLVYGLHHSDRALMTCLVFEGNGRQVHFVDGADGGYAAAAKEMKQRIKSK